MKYHLAVDIGASSGRHILGHVEQGRIVLEEVYRFENGPKKRGGRLCWDFDALAREVVNGLKACAKLGKVPATLGVDTWGVDFALVDREGRVLGDTVAYRDSRTQGMDALVEELIPAQELYRRTGIQKQSFNTIYQLMAVKRQSPELLEQAHRLLLVPDYLHYTLAGVMSNEYTEASTSGLVSAETKDWDRELLRLLGFPQKLFGTLSLPGTALGGLRPALREELGFDCQVVLPASHDTGSAFLAVPAGEGASVTLSSGTWSLLGVELEQPVTTPESRAANFTNEGGYQYRFRYLKNIMGLWMIQNLRREMAENGQLPGFGELPQLAREAADFPGRVDVDDPSFLAPESMSAAVRAYCERVGQPVPQSPGELLSCVYHSLAQCYAQSVRQLEALTGRSFQAVHIVGGGSQDAYLNQLTASATGLPVYAGPTEGTALGNLLVQMIAQGEFASLQEARDAIRASFAVKEVLPC